MSDAAAALTAGPPNPGAGWSRKKILFLITLVFMLHVGLVFIVGTKKQPVPRGMTPAPHWQLADRANEMVALGDPTLFARPNVYDVVSAYWQQPPVVARPLYGWTEAPRLLMLTPEKLGAAFHEFMQTNPPAQRRLDFKPKPIMSEPVAAFDEAMPPGTILQISGELAARQRLNRIELPSLSWNDVIAPSKVQALVDTTGQVASTVLLESSTLADADQRALQLARKLRFTPASRLMFGEIIFKWHTVPTNAP